MLESGNQWAWCSVCVTARYGSLEGETWLGGCSYESEESFRDCEYETMKADALEVLRDRAERAYAEASDFLEEHA